MYTIHFQHGELFILSTSIDHPGGSSVLSPSVSGPLHIKTTVSTWSKRSLVSTPPSPNGVEGTSV